MRPLVFRVTESCHAQCQTRRLEDARAYCDCGLKGPEKCKGVRIAAKAATTTTPAATSVVSAPATATAGAAAAAAAPAASSTQTAAAKPAARPNSNGAPAGTHQRHKSASASASSAAAARQRPDAPVAAAPAPVPAPAQSTAASSILRSTAFAFALPGALSLGAMGSPSPPPYSAVPVVPSECTYTVTGSRFAAQPVYSCFSCGLVDDLAVCFFCIVRCHAGHKVGFVSESMRSYCDCGSRGVAAKKGCGTPTAAAAAAASAAGAAPRSATPSAAPCKALVPLPYREAQALSHLCTLTQTGAFFHRQRVFHCRSCNIQEEEVCCQSCASISLPPGARC